MASPNFPSTGLVPNETKFTVGALTYLWDGEKWRTITAKLSADQITYDSSENVKEAIDSKVDAEYMALKIFQSPTDGGLTEIQTRTVDAGEVYEVRRTSDNSLATIYSNAAGTTEIVQNGTSNVSDSAGVVEFFVGDTFEELKIEIGASSAKFKNNIFIQQHTKEQGIGVWDTDTTYPVDGLAKGSDGNVYIALQEQDGNDPVSDGVSNWIPWLSKFPIADINNVTYISNLIARYGHTQAWVEALAYRNFIIDVSVTKTGTYSIPPNQRIVFASATVTQNDNLTSFLGTTSGWGLFGLGKIKRAGGKPSAKVSGSIGLYVSSTAFNHTISGGIRIEHFADAGAKFNGNNILSGPVGRSHTTGLVCHENWDGWQFLDGFPAEYHSLTNCFATDNANRGVLEETGNVNWTGGSITGNKGGVHLQHPTAGGNPHHGMFVGTNINHNIDYQLWAEIVAFGYDFVGCHFYDNGNSATGRIKLDNCRGVNITGGTLGCLIEYTNDGHPHVGFNKISDNKCEAVAAIVTGTPNFDRTKLLVERNFDISGDWRFNDRSRLEATQRLSSDLAPLTGQPSHNLTISMGNVISDNRGAMSGGTLILPWIADLEIFTALRIESDTAFTTEYVWIARDDAAAGSWSELYRVELSDVSGGTKASVNIPFKFVGSKGGQWSIILSGARSAVNYTIKEGSMITYKAG